MPLGEGPTDWGPETPKPPVPPVDPSTLGPPGPGEGHGTGDLPGDLPRDEHGYLIADTDPPGWKPLYPYLPPSGLETTPVPVVVRPTSPGTYPDAFSFFDNWQDTDATLRREDIPFGWYRWLDPETGDEESHIVLSTHPDYGPSLFAWKEWGGDPPYTRAGQLVQSAPYVETDGFLLVNWPIPAELIGPARKPSVETYANVLTFVHDWQKGSALLYRQSFYHNTYNNFPGGGILVLYTTSLTLVAIEGNSSERYPCRISTGGRIDYDETREGEVYK